MLSHKKHNILILYSTTGLKSLKQNQILIKISPFVKVFTKRFTGALVFIGDHFAFIQGQF